MAQPYREAPEGFKPLAPGGASGATAQFLIGLAMLVVGGYVFLDNVIVRSSWRALARNLRARSPGPSMSPCSAWHA